MFVHERGNIKGFPGMAEYVVCDGTRRLSQNITENIIKFQVGDSQAVLCAVFLTDNHVGKFGTVTHQVTELPYFRGRDKTGFYLVVHEQAADPFGILAVSFIHLLRFRILGMRKGNGTGLF